jgi:hypothetical protein
MCSSYLKLVAACPVKKLKLKLFCYCEFDHVFLSRMGGFLFNMVVMKVISTAQIHSVETKTGSGFRIDRRAFFGLVSLLLLWLNPAHAQTDAHILLQDSPLAGFQYHAGKTLWPQMRVGDTLTLIREPDNVHDAKAVRVEWQGQKIGYVPRRENADVARFMDGGEILVARISRLAEVRDPWSRVRFEILIPLRPVGQVTP